MNLFSQNASAIRRALSVESVSALPGSLGEAITKLLEAFAA